MSSSSTYAKLRPVHGAKSTANNGKSFSVIQRSLFDDMPSVAPGSMNDAAVIRTTLAKAIRECGKSREQLAEEISALAGTEVTVRRLNAFTAESREDYRFPVELARAFCTATGSYELLAQIAELAGLRLVGPQEIDLMRVGAEYLRQKRAKTALESLEDKLGGLEL